MKKLKKLSLKSNLSDDPLSGDLTSFIRNGNWKVAKFELKEPKNKVISLRLSEKLLQLIEKHAESLGIGTQKFIRILLESNVKR